MFIPLHDKNSLKHIRLQFVTLAIIIINVAIWLVMGSPAFLDQEAVQAAIVSYGFIPAVANGYATVPVGIDALPATATYFSYSFLHGNFMHLAGNMLFIWVFGDNVEDAMGHVRFFLFYFACAAAGAYGHAYFAPQSEAPLIGASGAVAGIVGAYLLLHPRVNVWVLAMGRIPLRIPAIFVLGFWILFQFYQLFASPDSVVSFAAHVGGALAGMVLVFFMRRPGVELFDRNMELETVSNTVEKKVSTSKAEKPRSRTSRTSVPKTGDKNSSNKWGR